MADNKDPLGEYNFKLAESLPLKYVRPLSQGGTMKDLTMTNDMKSIMDPALHGLLAGVL